MGKKSPEVDAFIAKAAPFARPILIRVRALFHKVCPEVTESIKWRCPHFEFKGLLGGVAVFKEYAGLGFWKASLMDDPAGIMEPVGKSQMSMATLRSVDDLPPDRVLASYIRQAVALNEAGTKPPPHKAKRIAVPADFAAAIRKNKSAAKHFEDFSASCRNAYITWVTQAKRAETRARRIATAVQWISQGRNQDWKYQQKMKRK